MSPNGYYVPYEKTLLQSMLYDGRGYVNERGERAMGICISKYGAVTLCMFVDARYLQRWSVEALLTN